MNTINKLIYDEDELRFFFDTIVPPLAPLEVYYVSLSARNKYLSEEDQVRLSLGRSEMFDRKIIHERDFNTFLSTIKRYETADGSNLTKKTKQYIPLSCITVYFNINPSNGLKAYQAFMIQSANVLFHYIETNRDKDAIAKEIASLDRKLISCYQRARGTKHYIDVDFDLPKDSCFTATLLTAFEQDLADHDVEFHVIETHSGYHVLLRKSTVQYNFVKILNALDEEAKKFFFGHNVEIVLNKNEMIPLPGCLQGGFEVKVLR